MQNVIRTVLISIGIKRFSENTIWLSGHIPVVQKPFSAFDINAILPYTSKVENIPGI
jgi:hypothetical protein